MERVVIEADANVNMVRCPLHGKIPADLDTGFCILCSMDDSYFEDASRGSHQ